MGAMSFYIVANGSTAKEAFNNAKKDALWNSGHSGYTGTIAEKRDFKVVNISESIIKDKNLFNEKIEELIDTKFSEKWGPAGCVKLEDNKYYFFGWASC